MRGKIENGKLPVYSRTMPSAGADRMGEQLTFMPVHLYYKLKRDKQIVNVVWRTLKP